MWRVKSLIIAFVSAALACAVQAQNPIFSFLGSSSPEEMDPYEVERLEEFMEHPLRLNHASESRLKESGLLSPYQAASLADYRARHGDVLSFSELAAVDGFGHDFVSMLAPFVSLESGRLPGASSVPSVENDISMRTSVRTAASQTYGLKYRLTAGERLSGGISISRTYRDHETAPGAYAGYLALHFIRRPGKVIIGDFNARFGQGLALWNGMSIGGLSSASSFMKKASGISTSSSFTGNYSFHGAAVEIGLGPVRLAAFSSVDKTVKSILPGINLAWYLPDGQVSVTHYADFLWDSARIPDMKTSADFAFCVRGADLFAESSYDWVSGSPAALLGAALPLGESLRLAAMLRCYPPAFAPTRSAAARATTKCSNEYASSMALDFSAGEWVPINGASGFGSSARRHIGNLSADFAYFPELKSPDATLKSVQIKAQSEWSWMISGSFKTTLRLSERIRTWGEPFRTDLRADLSYMSGHFLANLRLNALKSAGTGLLTYLEGTYKAEKLSIHLRTGLFRIDSWTDRIYVYERDAPGSFNVPAYYGRGLWAALTMSWKFARWGRMYMRSAMTSYPFMEEKKPGRAELKLQMVLDL